MLDCVVIGYNDINFHEAAVRARAGDKTSGAYATKKLNSVLHKGRRLTITELLNATLAEATGKDPQLNVFNQPSLTVAYLVGFLRTRGLETEFVNLFSHEKERLRTLLAERPRSVAITTTFYTEIEPLREIIDLVREHAPDTRIIVGGPFIFNLSTRLNDETQDYLFHKVGADFYVFDSQGESTLTVLVRALKAGTSIDAVPNLIWKDGETLRRTSRMVEKNALQTIPWTSFDPSWLTPNVYLRTARSCPFSCSFCNYPTVAGEHVVEEVEAIVRQLRQLREIGTRNVVFIDDTFNVPLARFKQLLRRMIEERLDLRWMSFFRCSNADDEAFELMERSGCVGVFLGIESGDETMLKHMTKFAKVDRYRYGIRRLKEHGIFTYASLIVGFPGETEDSVQRTIDFVNETAPTFNYAQIYYHDERAPIGARANEFGITGGGFAWAHNTMDWHKAVEMNLHLYRSVETSQIMPGDSGSAFGAFYLLQSGVSLERLAPFLDVAREMMLSGFGDVEPKGFDRLVSIFRQGIRPKG